MSEPNRAERRRSTRGGNAPPPKRDPMNSIYIGLGVIIVLVLLGFGISNYVANRARAQAAAFDLSTPTPGAQPTTKPIQLGIGQVIGKPIGFPQPNVKKGILSDTAAGGKGQPVDQIPCAASEAVVMHVHTDLAIFDKGVAIQVPPYIGMAASPTGGCLYWLHTHDASGVIHIEAGDVSAPSGGPFTLGMFFDIWGEPLHHDRVGPFKGTVTAFLNSRPYDGKLSAIPLRSHQRIVLEVGKPVVAPPTYLLPKGD